MSPYCYDGIRITNRNNPPLLKKVGRSHVGILSAKCEQHETQQGSGKSKSFPVKVLFLFLLIENHFVSFFHFDYLWHCCYLFPLQLASCYLFLDCNWSVLITSGQSIPEYSVDCVDRPFRSKNMCEYSQKMKDTQVSLNRTSLLSVVKNPIYLTIILRAIRKRTTLKISV